MKQIFLNGTIKERETERERERKKWRQRRDMTERGWSELATPRGKSRQSLRGILPALRPLSLGTVYPQTFFDRRVIAF